MRDWYVVELNQDGSTRRAYMTAGLTEADASNLCAEKSRRYPKQVFQLMRKESKVA